MRAVEQYRAIRTTRLGMFVIGIVELVAGYGFLSLSINNGNLICYIATILLFVWGIKNLIKLIGSLIYGKRTH